MKMLLRIVNSISVKELSIMNLNENILKIT